MTSGNRLRLWTLAGLAYVAAACSSSTTDTPLFGVDGVVQDLTLDPDGLTTVISVESAPAFVTVANVQADGGQNAQTVVLAGKQVRVTWDQRVTPTHKVRVVAVPNVDPSWRQVTSSDPSAPTFVVTDADQDTGDALLGGDTIEVTFSGPRVIEADAEDLSSWELNVNGQVMDLTGSSFDLDPTTQVLDITLGASANLHATFTLAATGLASVSDTALDPGPVAGAASGDAAAPTLLSVEQRLAQDPFGRVVDFSFDEPMDPVFAAVPARFTLVDHPDAVGTTLITAVDQPAAATLRLTFSRPVAPGLDTISHSGLMDAHGNSFAGATEAFACPAPIVNAWEWVSANTIEGGADTVVVKTTQSLDPDFGEDPARWSMTINAGGVVMADQGLSYDYLTGTLTITLDSDMRNGDVVVLDAVGQVDVDGEDFTANSGAIAASGDSNAPTFVSAVQNRTVDPSGYTLDVTFSEAMHATQAEDTTNYTFAPAGSVTSADIVGAGNVVRVVTSDLVMTPGDVTVTIDADVDDLAGNPLGAVSGPHPMTSTDVTDPAASVVAGNAIEGADNDTLVVTFDDDMVEGEVEDESNWSVESPVGTPFDLDGATIDYDPLSRSATVTLDAGDQALKHDHDLQVALAGMRDIGGNTVDAAAVGGAIVAEQMLPTLHIAWRHDAPSDGTLDLRFSEPSDNLEDLYDAVLDPYGTRFAVRDSGGTLRGYPHTATAQAGGLGVRLEYGFTIALTDTLDVIGVEDLAGNVMFPAMAHVISGEDLSAPSHLGAPEVTALSGEDNDTIVIRFTTPMNPWRVTDPAHYTIQTNPGAQVVTFGNSDVEWDGDDTVTITLGGPYGESVQAAENYDVTLNVDPSNPLRSDRGIPLAAPDTQTVGVSGDNGSGPNQAASSALVDTNDPNSLIVVFDEAVDEASVETPADFDYDGGNIASAVTLLSPRVVRATFGVAVDPGFDLVIAQASAVDLAGNDAGADMTLSVTSDVAPPLLSGVAGLIGAGHGGDRVTITFNEQVDTLSALDITNYAVDNGGPVALAGAMVTWNSVTQTVTIGLPPGTELDATQSLSVTVADVADAAGNPMSAPVALGGPLSGDSTAPGIVSAWTNRQEDSAGTTIDVLFDEQVDPSFSGDPLKWSSDGAAIVADAVALSSEHVRLTLDVAMLPGESVVLMSGLEDLARNAAGTLTAEPIDPID